MLITKHLFSLAWLLAGLWLSAQAAASGAPQQADPRLAIDLVEGRLTARIDDQPLVAVLTAIAEKAAISVDFYDVTAMQKRITVQFNRLPLEEGLRRILRENYVFSFVRQRDGGSRLSQIRIGDKTLRESAVRIANKRQFNRIGYGNDKTSVGAVREGEGAQVGPASFGVDSQGNLFVLDTVNNRVQVYDANGNHIRTIALRGEMPDDISLRDDGSLSVYDLTGTLHHYSPTGEFQGAVAMDETQWHTRGPMHWVNNQLYARVNGVGDRLLAVLEQGQLVPVPDALQTDSETIEQGKVGATTQRRYAAVLHEEQRGAEIQVVGSQESATLFIPLQDIVSVEVLGEDKQGNLYVKTEHDQHNQIQVEVSRFDPSGKYHGTLPIPGNDYDFWSIRTLVVTPEGVIHQMMPGEQHVTHATYQFN